MKSTLSAKKKTSPTPRSAKVGKTPTEDGQGSFTDLGLAPPDHEVYTMGPVISGRPLYPPRKISTEE
jgi:hypothetical protein